MATVSLGTGSSYPHVQQGSGLSRIRLNVVADGSGDATVVVGCIGMLKRLVLIPGNAGQLQQPSANWDLVITDEDSQVLYTNTTISNSVNTEAYPSSTNPLHVDGNITFTFENMGAGNAATVVAYFSTS